MAVNWAMLVDNDNITHCTPEILAESCDITEAEKGRRDALAGVRILICSLSILGTFTIVYSAIRRKQVCSPKVHPIFVLSIADMMLAALWLIGGLLWLIRTDGIRRSWCLAASLLTIILECVTINLTLVYAVLAYATIKQLEKFRLSYLPKSEQDEDVDTPRSCSVWRPWKSTLVYSIAWLLPIVLVMVPFAMIVTIGDYGLLDHVLNCTCWCKPTFGNVLPTVGHHFLVTAMYRHELRKLKLLYGIVLSGHYLIVFILLVTCYWKILKFIDNLRKENERYRVMHYGAIKVQIERAQSQAKRRVIYFIGIFTLTGFFNLVLSLIYMIHEARVLIEEDHIRKEIRTHNSEGPPVFVYVIYLLQSVTVPLQGFLNAIVYGWTREDFVNAVTSRGDQEYDEEQTENHDDKLHAPWIGNDQTLSVSVQEQNDEPPYIETEFENSDNEEDGGGAREFRQYVGSSTGSESEGELDVSIHKM